LNKKYFMACVTQLYQHYLSIQSEKKKILVVNTFGWVEGIGAGLQLEIVNILNPTHLVTLKKP